MADRPEYGRGVFWTSDLGVAGENPVELDELDLIAFDPLPSYVWYQDMVDFADGISDRGALAAPLNGPQMCLSHSGSTGHGEGHVVKPDAVARVGIGLCSSVEEQLRSGVARRTEVELMLVRGKPLLEPTIGMKSS